ncbi:S8 family peptidase [Candidatus Oscillochloris fontis]|uniref:S8 family peptidase n=1 Tax=Candidatus Oscillochloris fontis TaxID=2496868 RepID=UPI001EE84D4F|nr:S8 family peptidase [Candidatus Oscillochloris fontis]
MKQPILVLIMLLAILAVVAPNATQASESSVIGGELLVRLRPGIQVALNTQQVEILGASNLSTLNRELRVIEAYDFSPIGIGSDTYRIKFRQPINPAIVATRLARDPLVVYAEPNYRRVLLRTPNDKVLPQQWGLHNIQAFEAWDISTGAAIVIAVLDTGVDAKHNDLQGQILSGFNAFTGSNDSNDDNGHGTAVAGLIAANTNNGEGIAGICWGCKILPVKVLDSRGGGDDASVAAGIRWAVDNGARVINMSLGGSEESQTLRDAVDYAASRGVLMVAASGNERSEGNLPSYPAAYDSVIAVGATGNSDVVTGFSNTGPYVDLAAPGVGLWTTLPGNEYGTPNGTSFASPYVAGAAGLAFSVRPDLPIADIRCILEAGADDKGAPGRDDEYGWGRLNLLRSLQLAQNYTGCPLNPPAPNPNPTPTPPPPSGTPPAFAPIPPGSVGADRLYFPETSHSLGGGFRQYWEVNGGLSIFGFPISEEFTEVGSDGQNYTVQYFERHRFEFHPELAPPYHVLLTRIGDDTLRASGRDWFTFAKGGKAVGCLYFAETDQSICEPFLSYWRSNGLEFDGRASKDFAESLALFGLPLSAPQVEELEPGVFVTVQWFERARFEDHGAGRVLLGLLGNQLVITRGWR